MGADVKLSRRLTAIAGMVNTCGRYGKNGRYCLCDVGTDHAHIPIKLILSDVIDSAIAMDVIEGPLEKARQNIKQYEVEDRVNVRLSDGLDAYRPGEAQGLVIAGMGGRIMSRILLREPVKSRDFRELILQPQADPDFVRRALRELGLYCDREEIVFEDGKYYPVMHVSHEVTKGPDWSRGADGVPDETEAAFLQDVEDEFGPVLIRDRDKMLHQYLLWRKGVNDRIAVSLKNASDPADKALLTKKEQVDKRDRMIRTALEYFDR